MIRYLFLVVAIWLAFLILRHFLRRQASPRSPATEKSVNTVQCAHCGLHLPRHEAIQQNERFFCSREHQQAAGRE